jgi:hypothetical protein
VKPSKGVVSSSNRWSDGGTDGETVEPFQPPFSLNLAGNSIACPSASKHLAARRCGERSMCEVSGAKAPGGRPRELEHGQVHGWNWLVPAEGNEGRGGSHRAACVAAGVAVSCCWSLTPRAPGENPDLPRWSSLNGLGSSLGKGPRLHGFTNLARLGSWPRTRVCERDIGCRRSIKSSNPWDGNCPLRPNRLVCTNLC